MDKAIVDKELRDIIRHNALDGNWEFVELLTEALGSVRKHVPKKPILNSYVSWNCPECEVEYDRKDEEYYYCPYCGQKLDWR